MNETNRIQGLIEEIAQIEPGFREDIRGSEEAEVQRLEALVGRPLPDVHRAFLRAMGEDWGIPLRKAEFRCVHLVDYFEKIPWRPPAGYALIGLDNMGNGEDYFLDDSTDPPQVVLFPKGTNPAEYDEDMWSYYEVESPSLPDFVFRFFFFCRYLKGSPVLIETSKTQEVEGVFDRAVELLDRLGLPQHPRSVPGYAYYVTPGVSVVVGQPEGYGLGVEFAGTDRDKVERVYAVLDDHLGLRRRSG